MNRLNIFDKIPFVHKYKRDFYLQIGKQLKQCKRIQCIYDIGGG